MAEQFNVHWHILGQAHTHTSKVYIPDGTTKEDLRRMIAGVESGDPTDWPCVKVDVVYDRNGMIVGFPIAGADTPAHVAEDDRAYWADRYADDTE